MECGNRISIVECGSMSREHCAMNREPNLQLKTSNIRTAPPAAFAKTMPTSAPPSTSDESTPSKRKKKSYLDSQVAAFFSHGCWFLSKVHGKSSNWRSRYPLLRESRKLTILAFLNFEANPFPRFPNQQNPESPHTFPQQPLSAKGGLLDRLIGCPWHSGA